MAEQHNREVVLLFHIEGDVRPDPFLWPQRILGISFGVPDEL